MKSTITSDPVVAEKLAVSTAAQARFRDLLSELEAALNPELAMAAATKWLNLATTADEIARAQAEIARLNDPSAANLARGRASAIAHDELGKFKATLGPLVEAGIHVLNAQLAEAESAEEAFFQAQGLPREATTVSRRWNRMADELKNLLAAINEDLPRLSSTPGPGNYGHVIDWFQTG